MANSLSNSDLPGSEAYPSTAQNQGLSLVTMGHISPCISVRNRFPLKEREGDTIHILWGGGGAFAS